MSIFFLIAVVILILFAVFVYLFLHFKFKKFKLNYFGTADIKEIIEQAEIEDQTLPKSLSSLDSVYLENIHKDFPSLNVNELKKMAEGKLLEAFNCINSQKTEKITNEKEREFILSKISDAKRNNAYYEDFKIHKCVISKYENANGLATISFGISFQYYYKDNKSVRKMVQDRALVEYIYVIDLDKVRSELRDFSLSCPNCGSPIKSLGNKKCDYCGSAIIEVVKNSWNFNNIKIY